VPPPATPSWDSLKPVELPPQTSAPATSSARNPSGLTSDANRQRSVWERMGDQAEDAFMEFSPMAALGRALGTYDPTLSDPEEHARLGYTGETEARAARLAETSRANRERIAAREAADPAWRAGEGVWGNVGRVAADFGAAAVGGAAGDPSSLIGAGSGSILRQMMIQAGVGSGVDAATQGVEMGQGVRDEFDPLQTAYTGAGSAAFIAVPGMIKKGWDAWRGVPSEPGGPVPDLIDVTLDGGPRGSPDVEATLASAGYRSDMFSTPELAAQMAERIAAAQGRALNVPPEILAERAALERGMELGDVDPSLAPPPIEQLSPVVPPDVTLSAHPEFGTARMDDVGSIIATMRHMAARENVLSQGAAQADVNPAIGAILESNANLDQQAGTIWRMIADMDRQQRTVPEGVAPLDPNPPEVAPFQRSTVEAARGDKDGIALPVAGRISSRFGGRTAPKAGASTNHGGIDIAAPIGTPVTAQRGGVVIAAGEAGKNGNLVRIDHGNGVVTSYAHLDGFDVKIGDRVEAGQAFARVGNTGNSTGPHLHYGITANGERVDPEKFRFPDEAAPAGPDFVGGQRQDDPFDTAGGFERRRAQASPTNEELEAGKVFEGPDGIFRERGGSLYESPMATRGDQPRRPGSDPDEAPPGYKWSDERGDGPAPAPDSPSPGGGPRSGPGSGKGFFEDDVRNRMDDLMREYEASQSRRRERQQRQQQDSAGPDPSDRYAGRYGQKPAQGADGFWNRTDDGIVADKDGNPVAFRNAREAAKWATANQMAGDFELHTWGTNSERVVLKRRGNSSYGDAKPQPEGPAEPAAGRSQDPSQRVIEGPRPNSSDASPELDDGPAPVASSETRPSPREAYDASKAEGWKSPVNGGRWGPIETRKLPGDPVETHMAVERESERRYSDFNERHAFGNGVMGYEPFGGLPINADRAKVMAAWEAGMEHGRQLEAGGGSKPAQETSAKPEPVTPSREPRRGKSERVVTPAGREVDVEFEVRELRDVRTSDDPKFDKRRQPRDRGRGASDVQISDIAAKLDPAQLKGNRQAAHGAPIIGPDGMVEVGNGRTMALKRAYETNPEGVAAYRKMMEEEGFDLEGFEQPVLVRRRTTEIPDEEMGAWVNEAQKSGTMEYSAPEQAKADAGNLSDEALELYRGGELNSAGNRDFVKRWLKETGADTNALLAKDGTLSPDGVRRVQASILRRAFDDETLVAKLLGDADNNIRAIGNVLIDAAPKFAQVRAMAKAGEIPAEFDISGKVAEMAGLISRARSEGQKLGDLIGQSDIFSGDVDPVTESLVRLMFKDDELTKPRSQVRLKDGFDFYLEDAKAQAKGPGMFDDELGTVRPVDIIEAARAKLDAKDGPVGQGSFYKVISEKERAAARELSSHSLRQELRGLLGTVDPEMNDLITRLARAIDDDARLTYYPLGDRGGKTIAGQADTVGNRVYVGRRGDVDTLLHEAVHLALIRRYGEAFDELRPGDAGADAARSLIRLYNTARLRHGKYGFWNRKAAGHTVEYALSSVDEFIAEALSNRKFQRWLQRGTIWEKMVDGFRSILGLPKRFQPLLDDALRSGAELLDAARLDPVRVGGAGPAGGNVFGRKGTFNKIVDKDGLTRDAAKLRAAFKNPGSVMKGVLRAAGEGMGAAMFSADARGRAIADRIDSDAARELMDHFFAEPGKLDASPTGRTYHEAVQRFGHGRSQEAFRALDGVLGNPASERRVADLLRFPNKKSRATEGEIAAAKKLRELFRDAIEYRKAAGEEIGEVSDGYFPRWLDVEKVIADQDKFLAAAERVYRASGVDDAKEAAQGWLRHVFDTYAGLDGGLDIRRATGDAVGSRTAQARSFGKEADRLLADFYQDDLLQVTTQYFHGAARRAEQARRFGHKGAAGSDERKAWLKEHGGKSQLQVLEDRIRDDARKSEADAQGVMGVLQDIVKANLGHVGGLSRGTRAAVSWAHTWTQLGVMDKAVVTSLAEMMMGFTRGGLRRGLPFVADSMRYYVRQLRGAAPDDAQRWAEALGVAQDVMVNQALASRAGIDTAHSTEASQKVLAGFYSATTLHQYTEGTRIAAVKMGQELLRQLSHDMTSKSPRVARRAKRYLGELGIADPDAMAAKIREGGFDVADVTRESDKLAADYGTAVLRFVNQTIMRPTRAEKPTWANHPAGSLFFSLMSYSYGFKKNVLDRTGRLAVEAFKDKDPTLLMPAAGLGIMMAWQGTMDTVVRPAIFGGGPPDDETTPQAALRIVDRSGLTGPLSPLINAFTGARYRRGFLESLAGPVVGRPGDMITKVGELALNNSPNTNSAERAMAGAVYDNMLEPAIDGLAAARLLGKTRTAVVMGTGNREGGALPGDRDLFMDAVAGEKEGDD
jgi:murein DD-endopeptidase MepM/ murein hydrolase activator NlpD